MKANELMQPHVQTCHPNTNLEAVSLMMWDNDCGAIPIVNDSGTPVAMITDRDIAIGAALNHQALWDMTAEQIANDHELLTCNVEDSLQAAMSIMQAAQIRRLPVTDNDGKLQGILSMDDLILAAKPKKTKKNAVTYAEVMHTLHDVSIPVKPRTEMLAM